MRATISKSTRSASCNIATFRTKREKNISNCNRNETLFFGCQLLSTCSGPFALQSEHLRKKDEIETKHYEHRKYKSLCHRQKWIWQPMQKEKMFKIPCLPENCNGGRLVAFWFHFLQLWPFQFACVFLLAVQDDRLQVLWHSWRWVEKHEFWTCTFLFLQLPDVTSTDVRAICK